MDTSDYHTIKNFMSHAFGQNYASLVEVGQIAAHITEFLSEDVGTTIKTEGQESDPFGFTTIMPLTQNDDVASKMLKKFYKKTCPEKDRIDELFKTKKVATVFMERFVNLPADVAAPVYKQLLDDYNHAVKEDKTFVVDHIILSTPTYREVESALDAELAPKGKKTSKKNKSEAKTESQLLYYYGESELLPELADFEWDYQVDTPERMSDSKRAFGDLGVVASRRVFVLSMANFIKFVASIEAYIK